MDRTLKLLLDKVTQLTNRFNSITQNSKKIHELPNATSTSDLFIAVSDGENIGKVVYKPSEISKEEFDNIAQLTFDKDVPSKTIYLKDSEGNVLSTIDMTFLDGNSVKLNIDADNNTLQLLNSLDEVISFIPISDFIAAPKPKGIYVRSLTSVDLAQATITLDLPDTPDVNDFYDLHINGVYVNDDDYMVQQNKIIIAKSNIAYEISAGMKLTFRYRY